MTPTKVKLVFAEINECKDRKEYIAIENEIFVNGVIQEDYQVKLDNNKYIDLDPSMSNSPSIDVKPGDKIKIVVIKE